MRNYNKYILEFFIRDFLINYYLLLERRIKRKLLVRWYLMGEAIVAIIAALGGTAGLVSIINAFKQPKRSD